MSVYLKYVALSFKTLILTFMINSVVFAQKEHVKVSLPSHIEKVSIKGLKDFPLSATFYKGDPKAAGVLLLHDCAHDSSSYQSLGNLFSQQGLNALALDLRGFGESSSELFSQIKMKKDAKNVNDYQTKLLFLKSYWDQDVLLAYKYLRNKLHKEQGISLVTSGCSATQGVVIAETYRVNSFVLVSPIMDYMEKERYKNLIDVPSFFVSAIHHTDSYLTANELYMWNGDNRSAILTYKGNGQGDSLIKSKEHLVSALSLWVGRNLHHNSAMYTHLKE